MSPQNDQPEGLHIALTVKQLLVGTISTAISISGGIILSYNYINNNYVQKELYNELVKDRTAFETVRFPAAVDTLQNATDTQYIDLKNSILIATATPLKVRRNTLITALTVANRPLTGSEKDELRRLEEKLIELGEPIERTHL